MDAKVQNVQNILNTDNKKSDSSVSQNEYP